MIKIKWRIDENKLFDTFIFLFVFLFVYAAASKLFDYKLFEAEIGKSPLLHNYSKLMSWFVPTFEIVIALMLLGTRTQLLGLFAFYFLMLSFTLYIVFILNFSPYVPCSCGGILSSMGWKEHLVFNICFTVFAVVAVFLFNNCNDTQKISARHFKIH